METLQGAGRWVRDPVVAVLDLFLDGGVKGHSGQARARIGVTSYISAPISPHCDPVHSPYAMSISVGGGAGGKPSACRWRWHSLISNRSRAYLKSTLRSLIVLCFVLHRVSVLSFEVRVTLNRHTQEKSCCEKE